MSDEACLSHNVPETLWACMLSYYTYNDFHLRDLLLYLDLRMNNNLLEEQTVGKEKN